MPQSLSLPFQVVEHENQGPDCVLMNLEVVPSASPHAQQMDVMLTLRLGEQSAAIAQGRGQFGLMHAELRLRVEGSPLSDVPPSFAVPNASVHRHPDPSEKGQVTDGQATWSLQAHGASTLRGECTTRLGTIQVTDQPLRLEVILVIAPSDIRITQTEGLWRPDLSPNKYAILERKLAQHVAQTLLYPFPSWIQLCHQCSEPYPGVRDRQPASTGREQFDNLQVLIGQIIDAPTNDILELADRAGLNPLKDLAGGNLLGVTLSGLDLSEADLQRANLRGADLSDVELTEANLSTVILSGADLSGADLGRAILQDADLHRASFALANLSGAHLERSNLVEANLSNANLNGAKVDQARFANNPGMTDELKASLQERGAIVGPS